MTRDPIVDEVRRCRQEIAANSDFDLGRIIAAARGRQAASGHEVVSFAGTATKKQPSKPVSA